SMLFLLQAPRFAGGRFASRVGGERAEHRPEPTARILDEQTTAAIEGIAGRRHDPQRRTSLDGVSAKWFAQQVLCGEEAAGPGGEAWAVAAERLVGRRRGRHRQFRGGAIPDVPGNFVAGAGRPG